LIEDTAISLTPDLKDTIPPFQFLPNLDGVVKSPIYCVAENKGQTPKGGHKTRPYETNRGLPVGAGLVPALPLFNIRLVCYDPDYALYMELFTTPSTDGFVTFYGTINLASHGKCKFRAM